MIAVYVLLGVGIAAMLVLASSVRVIREFERGVVLRFGRLLPAIRGPGLVAIVPFVDRLHKANMQIITMPIPAQDGITRDNVTVAVDAVVYFRVVDPVRGGHRRPELRPRRRPTWAGVAALDHRQERSGRPAVQSGTSERGSR